MRKGNSFLELFLKVIKGCLFNMTKRLYWKPKIKITLKQGTQIPTIIEFVEVSGDRTVMKVAKISQDAKLDESVFDEVLAEKEFEETDSTKEK